MNEAATTAQQRYHGHDGPAKRGPRGRVRRAACVLAALASLLTGCARPAGNQSSTVSQPALPAPAATASSDLDAAKPHPRHAASVTNGPAASGPVASLDGLRPFYLPGEAILWEVTFLGIKGGRARFAVGLPGDVEGRRVVAVMAEAEAAGMMAMVRRTRDRVATWVDIATGLPTRSESTLEMKGKRTQVKVEFDARRPVAHLQVSRDGHERKETQRLPSLSTHDPVSAILLMRAWKAADGARATFHTLGGTRLWKTELTVDGRETIEVPLGSRSTIRVSGVSYKLTRGLKVDKASKPRLFTVWFSDDEMRVPLRVVAKTEMGNVEIRATGYQTGSTPMAASVGVSQ